MKKRATILTDEDLAGIRTALRGWGKPESAIRLFDEAMLMKQTEIWKMFVNYPWTAEVQEKYETDIVVRYWLQIAVEHVSKETGRRIQALLDPLDAVFKSRMKVQARKTYARGAPLSRSPYFWEEHTLVPPG
jgi:hypothetical protein